MSWLAIIVVVLCLWFAAKVPQVMKFVLRSYYVIEKRIKIDDPNFDYKLVGTKTYAGLFPRKKLPEMTGLQWFQDFLPRSGCQSGHGMGEIPPQIVRDFKGFAAQAGRPFRY